MVAAMKTLVSTNLVQSIMAKEAFVRESADDLLLLADWIRETFADGGKLLIFGNGGSAADAQHRRPSSSTAFSSTGARCRLWP